MPTNPIPASFSDDPADVVTAPNGALVHRSLLAHGARLEPRLWEVCDGVWCVVGNGLSNQTFVQGPEGLLVIDTGECREEMAAALAMVRSHTDAPIAAVLYTHFHYIGGTTVLTDEAGELPIWGHAGIEANLTRYGSELSAVASRGLIHQFGLRLPAEGPDALVNVGLGRFFRNPDHAPFTHGYVPATHTFAAPITTTLAGLRVELAPAPSDADDSVTIWLPDLGVCVHNLVWPALFNVFAIRGEEYRDPLVVLTGLDHLASLGADHLVATHGPPISGAADIVDVVTGYRDSVQFLWDQTVRGINKGLTADELTEFVQLPSTFHGEYHTQQHYGVAEHHVRQIHSGLRGWFDGDEAKLLPTPRAERCRRLVEGFGGAAEVRTQADAAVRDGDLRWAVELASWLVHGVDEPTPEDRGRLAGALRAVARSTTSANLRNWCLTRALELDGSIDLSSLRTHRFPLGAVLSGTPAAALHGLRVLVDPVAADGVASHLALELDGETVGLRLRNSVAVATDGHGAELVASTSLAAWATVLAGKATLSALLDDGSIATTDPEGVRRFFSAFDHAALRG